MRQPDFTYRKDEFFVHVMPETPAACDCWRDEIAPLTANNGKVFFLIWPDVLAKLRIAGYIVHKAKPIGMSDNDLLAALEA